MYLPILYIGGPTFTKSENTIIFNLYIILTQVADNLQEWRKDSIKHIMQITYFYLNAMPVYIQKLSKDLNLTISDEELKKTAEILLPVRTKCAQIIFNATKAFGLENDLPFIIH